MITKKLLCEEFIEFLSDTYIDFNGIVQTGQNKFNNYLTGLGIEFQLINNYSNGYQKHFTDNYCMILQNSDKINKDNGLIGQFSYEQEITLNLEMKLVSTPNMLYVLVNYIPEVLDILIVNFMNDLSKIQKYSYYNLSFSTNSYLETSQKNNPNPYGAVSSVQIVQMIKASLIKNIPIIGDIE